MRYVKGIMDAEDKNLLALVGSSQYTRSCALAPARFGAARLALPAHQLLVRIGPVKGVCCQAGQMINGAGWLAVRGCGAEWAFWTALSLHQRSRKSNRHRDAEKWVP